MTRLSRMGARRCEHAVFLLALLCTLFAPRLLRGQSFDATTQREPSGLNSKWLVHAGDDPAYARPDFDDSRWTLFDPSTSITAIYGKTRPSVIWYRLRVRVDPTQTDLALDESYLSYAFEIDVNGERLISSGSVEPYRPYTSGQRFNLYIYKNVVTLL